MRCVAAALVAALFPTLLSPAQGPPHDVDALYVAIANRPEPPRERANWLALHVARCDRPLDVLEAILRHRAWLPEESGYGLFGVRETAAHALHSIDPERAATLLFDHEPLVIEAIAGAIVGYEPPSWQPYDRWRRPEARFRATTLSQEPSRRQCLETLLCDDAHARREALAVLCMGGVGHTLPRPAVPRELVVRARRQLDRLPAMVALGADWRVALEDPDPRVRRYAILRCTRIPRPTWPLRVQRKRMRRDEFARAIRDSDPRVRFAAIHECRHPPLLIDVALDGSPLDRIAAMLAIADLHYLYGDQPSRLVPAVVNGLHDDSPIVRRAALRLAAKIGRPAAPFVPAIVKLALSDRTPNRAEAAAALGAIGGPVAVTTLIHLLHHPDIGVVDRAVRAIAAIGPNAYPAVEALLGLGTVRLGPIQVQSGRYWSPAGCGTGRVRLPPHPVPRTLVEHAIKQIGGSAVPELIRALDEPVALRDWPTRSPDPEPMVLFPDPPMPPMPVPLPVRATPTPNVHRILRLLQLLQSEGRAAGGRVARLLDDTDAKTRDLAAETLVQIGEGRRIAAMLHRELLRDPWAIKPHRYGGVSWPNDRHRIVVRLRKVDRGALFRALYHDHPAIRHAAAWGAATEGVGTLDAFIAALGADDSTRRIGAVAAAMRGAVQCRTESDRKRLRALTGFDDPIVRWGAVAALRSNTGDVRYVRDAQPIIDAIIPRLDDADARVQLAAIDAFPIIRDPDAEGITLDAFTPLLSHASDAIAGNAALRIAALQSSPRRDATIVRLLRERPIPLVIVAATLAAGHATRDFQIQLDAAAVALQASDDAVVAMLAERLARAIVPRR